MADPVLLEVAQDGVATLRLNRPAQKNAINLEMRPLMQRLITRVARDPAVRVLILAGSGGSFCAGGDIRDMAQLGAGAGVDGGGDAAPDALAGEAARRRMRQTGEVALAISTLDIPVIAAVSGPAYGAGLGLALAADLVLAAPDAEFCASFGRLGLVPDFGLHLSLPRRVGIARAKEMIFSARAVEATEAQTLGLVDALHPAPELEAVARRMASGFARHSPTALGLSKALLDQSPTLDLRQVLEAETAAQALCFTTPHHAEARRRFLARSPEAGPRT
ncbi:enoyl-CoA hydratase/isomerase family protein [Pseudooceanicola aestuarii]|uniref:enoyl-CoA hydratase/isomerase family protein n=1 Tax=Pseudooceanicola aestuarii TaxID=2697319 RepID=UPI0013D15F71|nr:enoyl-CoA hydratase/isomerase family protein [Pseudooceanicola aestuarii]